MSVFHGSVDHMSYDHIHLTMHQSSSVFIWHYLLEAGLSADVHQLRIIANMMMTMMTYNDNNQLSEMEKAADAADTSVLYFLAGANF